MRPIVAVASLLLAAPLLAGCASPPGGTNVDVLASFYPLTFLARGIAGSNVSVETIVPPGVEPHEYEPTTTDLVRVNEAKLLLVQGASFEAWLETARAHAKSTNVVTATEGVALRQGNPAEDAEDEPDPHTWLSPVLFAQMARNVERALVASFPEHAPAFESRADALVGNLTTLDEEYRAGLANCETRFIITSHAAFGYLAQEYNFTQRGISGLSPEAEPDAVTIQTLIDEAKAHNVTIVFFEELVSPRVAETIATAAKAQTRVLSPIEGIPEDEQARGASYETRMRENLASLREAMRCA